MHKELDDEVGLLEESYQSANKEEEALLSEKKSLKSCKKQTYSYNQIEKPPQIDVIDEDGFHAQVYRNIDLRYGAFHIDPVE